MGAYLAGDFFIQYRGELITRVMRGDEILYCSEEKIEKPGWKEYAAPHVGDIEDRFIAPFGTPW